MRNSSDDTGPHISVTEPSSRDEASQNGNKVINSNGEAGQFIYALETSAQETINLPSLTGSKNATEAETSSIYENG